MRETLIIRAKNEKECLAMKPILKIILIILCLTGCKTPQPALEDDDFYALINLLFQKSEFKEVAIFHKTINEGRVDINDQLKFEKLNANFPVLGGRIDFEKIMTQEDLDFVKSQTEDLGERKIDTQFFNFPARLVKKNDESIIHYYSEPFFTRGKNYAFIFSKTGSGGESFMVFEKVDGQWKFLCSVALIFV